MNRKVSITEKLHRLQNCANIILYLFTIFPISIYVATFCWCVFCYIEEWKNDPKHFGWKKDSNGWYYEEPIDKYDIESMAVTGSYKDFMRYEQDYLGQYVVIVVNVGSESSNNEYICNDTTYYPSIGQYMSNGDTIIIRDERYYDDIRWLEGDYIKIYGKFMGVETRSFVYKLTGVETELDVPVFEVYYADLVQE